MGAIAVIFTLALATTALCLPTTLKSPESTDQIQHAPAHGHQVLTGDHPDGSKAAGQAKHLERAEGVRSVSNDPSLTFKKQGASDGSVVQATQQVDSHEASSKDPIVQLKKSVKLTKDQSLPVATENEPESVKKAAPETAPKESAYDSSNVDSSDRSNTEPLVPHPDKPKEPAKPLQGIIEDVKDFGAPDDAVELPKDVTTLSDDSGKAPVAHPHDQRKPEDALNPTALPKEKPSTGRVTQELNPTNPDGDVTGNENKGVAGDSEVLPSQTPLVASGEAASSKATTPKDHPEKYHKISKREDTKHNFEKETVSQIANTNNSPKVKAAKSEVPKTGHAKMEAAKSTKPHVKTVQETADESKPAGFKTSREMSGAAMTDINVEGSDTVMARQSPDAGKPDSSDQSPAQPQVGSSTQLPPSAPVSVAQSAVPTTDAETSQEKPSVQGSSANDTAKNQTATPTEGGGGFNPFGPIRSVFQPIINAAASVRDQIRPVIGAALSPVLGPLSPAKGGATQNASTTTTAPQLSTLDGNVTSQTGNATDVVPQEKADSAIRSAEAPLQRDSSDSEARGDDAAVASDAKTVALPVVETNRNASQGPLGPLPVPFDPVAAINQLAKPAIDAATAVRDQVRPAFDAAVAPIVDAFRPTKEAPTNASTTATAAAAAEPQLRASDGMADSVAESMAEAAAEQRKRLYSNYKLFSVYIGNDTATMDAINALREYPEVDFWNAPTLNRNVSFLVPPALVEKIENVLKKAGIQYEILTDDIQRWLDREDEENRPGLFLEQRDIINYAFDKYHQVEEITGYLDLLAQKYSHIATVRNIGMTQEGRPIKGVILSTGSGRPVLWFDGGIHAREWVAPASLLYFLHKMATGYGSDSTITSLLQTFDFYIFPVVNPDGYAYTFTSECHRCGTTR